MNTPGTFVELTVDPQNERAVIGRYVLQTGEVSTHRSLVAETYGPSAARRRTAVQIALGPQLVAAIKEAIEAHDADVYFDPNPAWEGEVERVERCRTSLQQLQQLINQYEGA